MVNDSPVSITDNQYKNISMIQPIQQQLEIAVRSHGEQNPQRKPESATFRGRSLNGLMEVARRLQVIAR